MLLDLTVEDVHRHTGQRWFLHGIDITHRPLWWRCTAGHMWQETICVRTSPQDAGCPACATIASTNA